MNGATNTKGTVVTSGVSLRVFTVHAIEDLTDLTVSPETLEAAGTSTAGQSRSGLSFGGGVGALGSALSDLFDDLSDLFDDNVSAFALDEGHVGEVLPTAGFLGAHRRDGDVDYWTRSWSDDSPVLAGGAEARVRGADAGVELPMGTSLRLGVSLAPEVSVSSGPSVAGTRLDGTRYAVRGGWRGETCTPVRASRKGATGRTRCWTTRWPGGGLSSAFGLVQDHVQLGAGARMTWGAVRVAPSVTVLSGALRQDAHTAEGAAFRAEVPAFSQRYQGWKSELRVSPAKWLRGPKSLRWRPALHLYSQRTHSTVPESLDVAQHDRAGVLSLSSAAEVSGLPRTVHGFNATVDALHSKAWRMQLGLAGMKSDGDYTQAVYARLHYRFSPMNAAGGRMANLHTGRAPQSPEWVPNRSGWWKSPCTALVRASGEKSPKATRPPFAERVATFGEYRKVPLDRNDGVYSNNPDPLSSVTVSTLTGPDICTFEMSGPCGSAMMGRFQP